MIYQKTHEGRAALRERNALTLRERQLMVLFNGSRTMDELTDLFGEGVMADVDSLARRGLIVVQGESNPSIPDILLSDLVASTEEPPTRFLASELDTHLPPVPEPASLPRMSLQELARLADVPVPDFALMASVRAASGSELDDGASPELERVDAAPQSLKRVDPPRVKRSIGVATAVNSIDAEHLPVRTPVAAQAYMTQVLMALGTDAATALIETSGDVRHDVDILMYLAQGIGHTYAVAGEDVTLRVALRISRLLPERELPMLLDCTLDYVPTGFSVLLYEFVLAGRDTGF